MEHKFVDVGVSLTAAQAGTVGYLSAIPQGDNVSEREGNSIKIQSFEFKGFIVRNGNQSASEVEAFRVIVVRDLQNQGAAPTGADILETVGSIYAPIQHVDFINGSDLNKRFTVVYDELITLDLYHPSHWIDFKTNHDCHVFYRGIGSTVTSAGNGSYFMLVVSDRSTNPSALYMNTRLRYTDN